MVARKRKTTRNLTSTGKKLLPTIKKQGLLKGSGMYAAKQTGIKAMSKVVPAYLMVVGLAAATPPLGAAISRSVSTIPVVGELTNEEAAKKMPVLKRAAEACPCSKSVRWVSMEEPAKKTENGSGSNGSKTD